MPASDTEESETWAIVAYLRSLSPSRKPGASGDRGKGEKIFRGSGGCSTCHMVKGQGGLLGPDLSRVGASRSVSYLIDSLRDPNKELSSGMTDPSNQYGSPLVYDKVTATTASGEEFVGIAMNEDTFSLQLLGTDQKLHLFVKKELKQVIHEQKSLMPAYSEQRMGNAELQDLIAYLQSLTGS
jgi:cytochrome c oxidase cbb3-type subunit 3